MDCLGVEAACVSSSLGAASVPELQELHAQFSVNRMEDLRIEAACAGSSPDLGVANVPQLHAYHPKPKSCIFIGHQLQRGD